MDKKYASSKQSFKQVRGNAKPPLTEIKEVIQDFVKVIPTQHFPVHPAISIDMMNPDLWIAAIKKQKAGSARGIAVSSQEFGLLPRGFVATLAHTRAQCPTGFPAWFMTALPKHDDLPEV